MLLNKTFALIIAFSLLFPSRIFPANTLAPAGMAETGLLGDDSERISVLVNIAVENDFVPTRIQALEELLSFEAAISVDDIDRLATRLETDLKDKNKKAAILAAELVMMNIQTLDIEKYLKVSEKLMEVTGNGLRVYEGVIRIIVGQSLLNLGKKFFERNDYENAHRCYALVVKIKKFEHTNASTIRENAAHALCDLAETMKDKSDLTDLYKSSLFLVLQYAGKEYSFNRVLDKEVGLLTGVPMSRYVLELIDIVLERPYLIRKPIIFNVIVQAVNDLGAETVIKKLTKALPEVELLYQLDFAKLLGSIGEKIINFNPRSACDALIIDLHQGYTDDSKKAAELIASIVGKYNDEVGFYALCHALQDKREDVSREAAKQLGLLRRPKAVEHLIPVMSSNFPKRSAQEAAKALGLIGTENAINALINMIRFRTGIFYITGTRIAAIKALGVALSNMGKALTNEEAIHNQELKNECIETLIAASRWGREAISTQATHTLVSVSGKSEVINRIFANQKSWFHHKRLTAVEAMGEFVNKWNTPEHRDEFMSMVQQDKINKRLLIALNKNDKQMREKAIEAFDKTNFHTAIIPLLEVIKTTDDPDVFKKAVETVAHLVEKNRIDTIKPLYLQVIYDTFSDAYQKGKHTFKEEIQKGAEQISKVLDENGLQATAASFVKIYEPTMRISAYVLKST